MLRREEKARIAFELGPLARQLKGCLNEIKAATQHLALTYPRATEGELIRAVQREFRGTAELRESDIRRQIAAGRAQMQNHLL